MCSYKYTFYFCRHCKGKLTGTVYEADKIENIAPNTHIPVLCPGRNYSSARSCQRTVRELNTDYWCTKTACKKAELQTVGVTHRRNLEDVFRKQGYEPPEYLPAGVKMYEDYNSPTNGFHRTLNPDYFYFWTITLYYQTGKNSWKNRIGRVS